MPKLILAAASPAPFLCNNKCGEIKMTTDAQQFQLICDFCTKAYTELLEFIKHIQLKECPEVQPHNNQEDNSENHKKEITENERERKPKIEQDEINIELPDPLEFVSTAIKEEMFINHSEVQEIDDDIASTVAVETITTTTTIKEHEEPHIIASKEILIYLIEVFKQHEVLWIRQEANSTVEANQNKAYNQIKRLMNDKFNDEHYTKKSIIQMLNDLKTEYVKMHSEQAEKLWFYEQLSFLQDAQEFSFDHSTSSTAKVKQSCSGSKKSSTAVGKVLKKKNVKNIDPDFHQVSSKDSAAVKKDSTASKVLQKKDEDESSDADSAASNSDSCDEEDSGDLEEDDKKSGTFYCHEVTVALLELFKDKRSLWDRAHLDFYKYTERRRHYQELTDAINARFNLTVHQSEMRKRMQLLLNIHRQNNTNHKYYKYFAFIPKDQKCPFACQYCGKRFSRQKHLVIHEYSHTNIKQFACGQCEKTFWSGDHLKAHQKIHQPAEQFEYLCDECGLRFRTTEMYKKHLYRKHNVPYPHYCEICQHGFIKLCRLKIHMRVHTGEKPFQCTYAECDRTFSAKVDLRTHLDRHANRKAHICPTCGKAFCTREELKIHLKAHANIRDYACEICHKRFVVKTNLRAHQAIHSDEKRFECKVCGKRFKQASSRTGHMKLHRTDVESAK